MFDHPIIILIILIAALLRWLSQKSEQQGPDPERPVVPDDPIPRADPQSDEERIRKFLEALGRPETSTPPPKVSRRFVVTTTRTTQKSDVFPKGRSFQSPLPPLTTVPPPLPTESATTLPAGTLPQASIKQRVTQVAPPRDAEILDFTAHLVSDASSPSARTVTLSSDLLQLASIRDLRRAIILREVFGPPRGLQPFAQV